MEALGTKLRRQRRRLGLTLDELAGRTGISKPYLSLIETGRVANPPSDDKLRRLEQTLGFPTGELLTQAHLQRTPSDVRVMLQKLIDRKDADPVAAETDPDNLGGVLQHLADHSAGNAEYLAGSAVPVINRVSINYPEDFSDLSYAHDVACDYVLCPDVQDKDAFAARVFGDSMTPRYRPGDIVIFSPAVAVRHGDDCFVRFTDGRTTFRRVFFENDDRAVPVLRLQPRNEFHRADRPRRSGGGASQSRFQVSTD